MKTILAPLDFSATSPRVLEEAIALARALGGRIVLLHVVQPPPRLGRDSTLAESGAEFATAAESDATRRLAGLQESLRASGVMVHAVHRAGNPGNCIVHQAERLAADYIVIGSHGHSAFYDLVVGSTTTRVLKDATCRVVVVPPGLAGVPRAERAPASRIET